MCAEEMRQKSLPNCPSCDEAIDFSSVYPDVYINKQMKKLLIKCTCGETVSLMEYEGHWERVCPEACLPCKYGCGEVIQRGAADSHLESCKLRPKICQFCNFELGMGTSLQEHLIAECKAFQTEQHCAICQVTLKSGLEAASHELTICFERKRKCPFPINADCLKEEMNCTVMKKHLSPDHIPVLAGRVEAMEGLVNQNKTLTEKVSFMETELTQCKSMISNLKTMVNELTRNLTEHLPTGMDLVESDVAKVKGPNQDEGMDSGMYSHNSRHGEDPAFSDGEFSVTPPAIETPPPRRRSSDHRLHMPNQQHIEKMAVEKVGVASVELESRMSKVECTVSTLNQAVQRSTQDSTNFSGQVVKLQQHVTELDNRAVQHSNILEEVCLRQELLEVKTTSGCFVWKINDVSRRYRDALEGRTLSLYSPPFYTSPHGYRMCLRAYLYGDGVGKGSFVSVFFVIMRSEHDDILAWPFKQKVSISLINQDTPSENYTHITETFLPDVKSNSFAKPRSEMNVASGFPKFVKGSVLKDPKFVRNDVMYIRCKVDRTGLTTE